MCLVTLQFMCLALFTCRILCHYYLSQTYQGNRYDVRQCVVRAFDLCHEYHTLAMTSTLSIPRYCVYEIMYSDTDECIFKAVASKITKKEN